MMIADCPACMLGDHSKHVEAWGTRSFGIIDGESCRCPGDCAERGKEAFDRILKQMNPEALSPAAHDLLWALKQSNPSIRDKAVKRINALMEADPLDSGPSERMIAGAEQHRRFRDGER